MSSAESTLNVVARGAVSGVIATVLMSIVIAAGHVARLWIKPPPHEITENVLHRVGVRVHLAESTFHASWVAAHLGYGAVSGVFFTLFRPRSPFSTTVTGLIYGAMIWILSYLYLMPTLNLYPWPRKDQRSLLAVMIAAHLVFGVSLAEINQRLLEVDRVANHVRSSL